MAISIDICTFYGIFCVKIDAPSVLSLPVGNFSFGRPVHYGHFTSYTITIKHSIGNDNEKVGWNDVAINSPVLRAMTYKKQNNTKIIKSSHAHAESSTH